MRLGVVPPGERLRAFLCVVADGVADPLREALHRAQGMIARNDLSDGGIIQAWYDQAVIVNVSMVFRDVVRFMV